MNAGTYVDSESWDGRLPEPAFHFSGISNDSMSGEESPIVTRKSSQALSSRQRKDESKAWKTEPGETGG
ncbi:hypothetical protein TNCV_3674641 [Trichonephila clavipes]|nr:hypothetical protein TNCV_3674641 [Trichonephila clavipes]